MARARAWARPAGALPRTCPSSTRSTSCGGRQIFDLVDDETLAPDHAALAHEEDLHRGLELVVGDADHVDVLVAVAHDLLFLDGPAHTGQPVAQAGRLFELHAVRRGEHLLLETLDDLVGVAVEERQQLVDQHLVGGMVRSRRRTAPHTSRCGRADTDVRAVRDARTCDRCRCGSGRCAATSRASHGWRRRGRMVRSSARPSSSHPASPWRAATLR